MYTNINGDTEGLKGICSSCMKPNSLFDPLLGGHYCPACGTRIEGVDRAEKHLLGLFKPVIKEWRKEYIARGLSPKMLKDALYCVASNLEETFEEYFEVNQEEVGV